ncbi:MAG TPA: NifB/NifX family molybdenum-iron cluster-binding protein [Acidobacteriota bacterium]|nr:NifB/NifX family molybdenum-iron cluster-binding protein [Acidobacteriota bacterium]
MKAVITAQAGSLTANVDPRFGRASCFILYDTETGEFTAHSNEQNKNAAQGAGIQAAQNVARLGPEVVITGHVGPKALEALRAAGIKVCVGASGAVQEALATYQAGKLEVVDKPDVDGHWM